MKLQPKIKYALIFDTNSLLTGKPIKDSVIKLINKYKRNTGVQINFYMPQTVSEEIKSKMPQYIIDAKNKHSESVMEINGLLGTSYKKVEENFSEAEIKEATEKMFRKLGFEMLKTPEIDFIDLLNKAINHIKPFAPSGDAGFKDAVIMETVKFFAPEMSKSQNVVFICNDERLRQHANDISSKYNYAVYKSVEEFESDLKLRILNSKSKSWLTKNLTGAAEKIFFVKDKPETLFYVGDVENKIYKKFSASFVNPNPVLDYGTGYAGVSLSVEQGKWIPRGEGRFDVYKPLFTKKDKGSFIWESKVEYNQRFENINFTQYNSGWLNPMVGGMGQTGNYNLLFSVKWSCKLNPEGKIDSSTAKVIDIQQNRIWPYHRSYMQNTGGFASLPTTLSGTVTPNKF